MAVNSLKEAMNWFLENSSGNLICIKDGEERICECYTDAVEFYKGDTNEG